MKNKRSVRNQAGGMHPESIPSAITTTPTMSSAADVPADAGWMVELLEEHDTGFAQCTAAGTTTYAVK